MSLALIEEKVQQTIRKNMATSYGLTLAIGLPLSPQISARIQGLQQHLETLAPGWFTWYGLDHLHATLVAPLRGRYRDYPPIRREELPANLQGFVQDLADFFVQHQPFEFGLVGVRISDSGFVLVGENTFERQLASTLHVYPELDKQKHARGLHVAIGYCSGRCPFATDEAGKPLESALCQLLDTSIGTMMIDQVWLVHYANRTLNRIVGKVPFVLGQSDVFIIDHLLRALGIISHEF